MTSTSNFEKEYMLDIIKTITNASNQKINLRDELVYINKNFNDIKEIVIICISRYIDLDDNGTLADVRKKSKITFLGKDMYIGSNPLTFASP